MDEVEAAFIADLTRTAELVMFTPGAQEIGRILEWRRPNRKAQTEKPKLKLSYRQRLEATHAACQRLKLDTRDAQLQRADRQTYIG